MGSYIVVDSAKTASDTRELLRLTKKEEAEQKAKAIAMSHETPPKRMESPIDDGLGAWEACEGEATPDIPAEVAQYIRKLLKRPRNPQRGVVYIAHKCQYPVPKDGQRGSHACAARR